MKFQDLKSTSWALIEPHHLDWQHYDWPLHYRDFYWKFLRFSSNSSFFFDTGRDLKVRPFQARIDPNYLNWQHSGVTTIPPWLLLRAFLFFLLVTLFFRYRKNLKVLTTQKLKESIPPLRLATRCLDQYTTVTIAETAYFFYLLFSSALERT